MFPRLSNTGVDRKVERVGFILFFFFPGVKRLSKYERRDELWEWHSGNGPPWYFPLFLLLCLPSMSLQRWDSLEKVYAFFLLRMAAITSEHRLGKQINEKLEIFRHQKYFLQLELDLVVPSCVLMVLLIILIFYLLLSYHLIRELKLQG